MIKTSFRSEFVTAAREAPRLFFAPLVGAIQAVRKEARRTPTEQNKERQDSLHGFRKQRS
ncbi:hypothetical protein ACUXAV_004950 [Cupriavidus metallidurans]|jgi:hypothetical protein|uniref:hypothetical protein n=1 Tax=Cupriavidus TaxID=106589 RepID=UPI0004930DBA|nr:MULTISPECIES: hypothetical protein [Cupriavidus]AVA38087.1 hypothetical protein C3Z06_31280 [Cupriavidus metallidurans]MCA3185236.1 hypothetical protein [Cupriavidus sp.]MCA3188620.1 hypothetical protein [Cupriavidus sp.]MCA3232410.1 hypothetical protein [Cupriavidus sp.]MDE4922666.1 hypothetical protein [Cupriavidus metallidurans]